MREENRDSKIAWASGFFALATVCTLPFVVIFITWLIDVGLKQQGQIPRFLAGVLIFGWPVLLLPAILGLISIVIAWISLPKVRIILVLYAISIIGFMIWFINGIESMAETGP